MAKKRKPLTFGKGKYNPDQPRDPGGEGGGQWANEGAADEGTEEEGDAHDEQDADQSDEQATEEEDTDHANRAEALEQSFSQQELTDKLIETAGTEEIHEALGENPDIEDDFDAEDDSEETVRSLLGRLPHSEVAAMLAGITTNEDVQQMIEDHEGESDKSAGATNMKKRTKKQGVTLFVPLRKVDEENRLVYGTAAQGDVVDLAKEVFDYEGSKPYFEKWSANVEKASGGKSLGNVRAMHANKAAGKLTTLYFNDDEKAIDVCAKIVDEDEWQKVLEGVYTGFSIGGSYVKKWKDEGGQQRYIADPVEISVVDVPCIPTATFDLTRADGTVVKMAFKAAAAGPKTPTATEIAAKALEMATAAANNDAWVDHIDAARDFLTKEAEEAHSAKEEKKKAKLAGKDKGEAEEGFEEEEDANEASSESDEDESEDEEAEGDDKKKKKEKKEEKPADEAEKAAARNSLVQVWKATDGRTFNKKEDATGHQATINARKAAHPLTNALGDLRKALSGDVGAIQGDVPEVFADLTKAAKALKGLAKRSKRDDILAKSMWEVSSFARLLEEFACIQSCIASEAEWEADGSPVPANLKANIQQLTLTFVELAMEEAAELIARMRPEDVAALTDAGAGTADEVTSQEVDPTDDPEVAVHAAEAAKFIVGEKARLEKVGARNSKNDSERLQKAHDALVELGVMCKAVSTDDTTAAEDDAAEKLAKASTELQTVTAERDQLQKVLDDAVPEITKLKDEVLKLKAQPNPPAPRTHVVEKGTDVAGTTTPAIPATLAEALAKMTPDQLTDLAIRAAQSRPQPMIDRGQR